MDTPIVDFVKAYKEKEFSRFHMPGHKGHVFFGWEPYDITEIEGADVLHLGDGIITESEKNAASLFGAGATHYSTEGSSLCIKAMLAVLKMEQASRKRMERSYILAGRNIHRSMVDACALLDLDIEFIRETENGHICTSKITPELLEASLERQKEMPLAVYLTSPDYLGECLELSELAKVCELFGAPLVVDHAHGAYLHFLNRAHPMDAGAAMCCDSAHKTLPVLTGGAYLHIHKKYLERFEPYVRQALTLFGSTSPSYLVLQSLDLCNRYLAEGYEERLKDRISEIEMLKEELGRQGLFIKKSEPLKIVLNASKSGYTGLEAAEELREFQMECEYADQEYVVFMLTPENTKRDLERLYSWGEKSRLVKQPKKEREALSFGEFQTERVLSVREAVLSKSEWIPTEKALGRVCSAQVVSCPPAVPIAVSGERISEEMIRAFSVFKIAKVSVVADL